MCDGSLCAITVCRAHSASVTSRLDAELVRRVDEHHELVVAEHDRRQARFGG
jgi:hypothetical protein